MIASLSIRFNTDIMSCLLSPNGLFALRQKLILINNIQYYHAEHMKVITSNVGVEALLSGRCTFEQAIRLEICELRALIYPTNVSASTIKVPHMQAPNKIEHSVTRPMSHRLFTSRMSSDQPSHAKGVDSPPSRPRLFSGGCTVQ